MNWVRRVDQEPESKDDCSERYLAWNGEYVTIINHGWDNYWLDARGLICDFTHWMALPDAPK